ncbi:hypothetical protein ACFU44_22155 [Nocardia rhizosphaerihabitans]
MPLPAKLDRLQKRLQNRVFKSFIDPAATDVATGPTADWNP